MKLYIILFLMGLSFISSVIIHEDIHKEITINYGCKEVNIDYFNGLYSTTTCLEYYSRTKEMQAQENYLQSWAELIGYNVQILVISIWLILLSWIFYIELKETEK